MSLRREVYKCICGGEIVKISQNGAVSRSCDNCDVPTSSLGIRDSILSTYDQVMRVELVRDDTAETIYVNSFPKKEIEKGNLLNLLNGELKIDLEIDESDEYTKVKHDKDVFRIYLNGLPLIGKDYILLINDKISKDHEYKNSIFDRD